jgi:hypothetical protein
MVLPSADRHDKLRIEIREWIKGRQITGGVLRAVVFVRWKNTCDVALRFLGAESLEHYGFCGAQLPAFESLRRITNA